MEPISKLSLKGKSTIWGQMTGFLFNVVYINYFSQGVCQDV
jgi:hypothetical protein